MDFIWIRGVGRHNVTKSPSYPTPWETLYGPGSEVATEDMFIYLFIYFWLKLWVQKAILINLAENLERPTPVTNVGGLHNDYG